MSWHAKARGAFRRAAVVFGLALHSVAWGAALEPKLQEGNWEEAAPVLQRWLEVQGLDRGTAEIYPRDGGFEISQGGAKPVKARFIDSGGVDYWLAIQRVDGARHGEISWGKGGHWFLSEELGIGRMQGTSPLAEELRKCRISGREFRETFVAWARAPDYALEGKTHQIVRVRRVGGGAEFWWFDPENGTRVRVDVMVGDKVARRLRFSDFREVDGALEPFEVRDGDGPGQSVIKVVKLANGVKLAANFFAPTKEQVRVWDRSQEVLNRYVKAAGGLQALAQIVSRVTKMRGENASTGVEFEITMTQKAAPDRFLVETKVAGLGQQWQGYDGETAWELSEIKGFRTMRGQEVELFRRNGALDVENIARRFPIRKLLGTKEIDGRKVVVMELASRGERAGAHSFDVESGQLVRVESTVRLGAEGELAVTIDFSDFRQVDAVTLPYRTVLTNPAMRVVTTLSSVQHNVELDDAIFRPRKQD